MLEVRYRPGQF